MNELIRALIFGAVVAAAGCAKPPKDESPPPKPKTEQIENKQDGTTGTKTSVPLPGK